MIRTIIGFVWIFPMLLLWPVRVQVSAASPPVTIYWESAHLALTKVRMTAPNEPMQESLALLRRNADEALARGPYSVMKKKDIPPSGNKHDYMSFSRYWWPNPNTSDGLPYVRHDGRTNSTVRARGDRDQVGMLIDDVETLALAYYYFEDERYAKHASALIRTWFLDSRTRMNPHLNYGQAVPGRTVGRGVGIIDTRGFILVLDATALLSKSEHFTGQDLQGLKQWFEKYLVWLRTSKLGVEESRAANNHGSWYAAQVARIAMFVGHRKVALQVVDQVRAHRIPHQFRQDGSQPEELSRTRSLHYSIFNLAALSVVARVGEMLGIDLWHVETDSSGGMKAGLEFIMHHIRSQQNWSHPQMEPYQLSARAIQLFRMASVRYAQPAFLAVMEQVGERHPNRNFAALQFRADAVEKYTAHTLSVKVVQDSSREPSREELPDISAATVQAIRGKIPTKLFGMAKVGLTTGEPILTEAFRGERRQDFAQRQGTTATKVIIIQHGAVSLSQLVQQVKKPHVATEDGEGIVTLRLPVLIQPDATLVVDGKQTPVLRLSTERGAFIANAGAIFVLDAEVTSWSEVQKAPTPFCTKSAFRPFIASYIRSRTFLAGSKFCNLGCHAATSYGVSLTSQPERRLHSSDSKDLPTGIIVGNEFRGLYYGFYSYEARDVVLVNNIYANNILYGIDPHDRSTRLIIARNRVYGTRDRHGIIGSRGISDSYIFENRTHENRGTGIMLDRDCTDNVVQANVCYKNGQGIAIYESPRNLVVENLVVSNAATGIKVRNSTNVDLRENTIVGNGGYAFDVYAKRLDDHNKRVARGDFYDAYVGIRLADNTATGNDGGLLKAANLGTLRLSMFKFQSDMESIGNNIFNQVLHFDTKKDRKFGSDLERYADVLNAVFQLNHPVVEVSGR